MTVYLVGAGPGDPGLMTARSLELIARADVIIHDRLIPSSALDGARPDAQLIYAGKEGGGEQVPQAEITRLLIEHGRSSDVVVRLKGGDPFVFGRGGEEAEALLDAGIAFEVVPGVTAGIAAPAYAGIPVTHRDAASSVAFLTGHEDPDKAESALDWQALSAFPGTLVVYMGVRQLPGITARLIDGGRSADEPAALIQRGTLPGQRAVQGTLATIAQLAVDRQIKAPTIAVFGPVAALHERLAWLEQRPLHGVTIAVTRAREQASRLAERLRRPRRGGRGRPRDQDRDASRPASRARRLRPDLLHQPHRRRGAVRASARRPGLDTRAFPNRTQTRIAAIGPATARALRLRGIETDVMPTQAVGRGSGRGARERAGDAGAGGAGSGGARRRARCVAGPRRRGRRRAGLRDRRRASDRGANRGCGGRRLHHLHVRLHRPQLLCLRGRRQKPGWRADRRGRGS